MEPIDYWRLADELNPIQASLLMLNYVPDDLQYSVDRNCKNRPDGYVAFATAIKNAILSERLPANMGYGEGFSDQEVCWPITTFKVEDLKKWLRSRGFKSGFFFEGEGGTDDFLEKTDHYAPKLAAAVTAWRQVSKNPSLLNGKSPKQAIDKWLRENANQFELTKDDGNPNESAIAEISKIANWNPQGGAVKTPSRVTENPPTPSNQVIIDTCEEVVDDTIPF